MKTLFLILFFTLSSLFASSTVVELEINGLIGPPSSEYLKNAITTSINEDAKVILVKLDTSGGLSTSMREMIQYITNSPIPVVMYVYPKGSRAASAGTYLMYASQVAAMAPGTNIGAATPINLMSAHSNIAEEKKALNDAVAYITSLAELNDRNISWAQSSVLSAKSISAQEALKLGVINLIADNKNELLNKLDGRVVKVAGHSIILNTKDVAIVRYAPDWKVKFLSTITNPNITYILLLIAIYGIFFELINPGGVLPGAIGAIAGIIVLYALNMIPFNYAGLLLIILGISFIIAEVFVGFGILGIGGVIAFAFGSILLFDTNALGNTISIPLVIAFSLVTLGFFIMLMRLFVKSRSAKIVTGEEEMIGSQGVVVDVTQEGYHVFCHAETWNAHSQVKLSVGERVQVVGLKDLVLEVKPLKE